MTELKNEFSWVAKGIPEQVIDIYLAIIGKSKKPKNTRKKGKKERGGLTLQLHTFKNLGKGVYYGRKLVIELTSFLV